MRTFNYLAPHKLSRFTTTGGSGAVTDVPGRVYGVLLFGGSAASSLKLTNDANGAGVALLNVNAVIANTVLVDLSALGPVMFDAKIYATIAGAGAEAYIFWE